MKMYKIVLITIHSFGMLFGILMTLHLLVSEPIHIFLLWSVPFWVVTVKTVLPFTKELKT